MTTMLKPVCSYTCVDNVPEKLVETSNAAPDVALAFSGPVHPSTKELSSENAQMSEGINLNLLTLNRLDDLTYRHL